MVKALFVVVLSIVLTGCANEKGEGPISAEPVSVPTDSSAIPADSPYEQCNEMADYDEFDQEWMREGCGSEYECGKILVTFAKEGIHEKVLNSYGLSVSEHLLLNQYVIEVPEGEEYYWACVLDNDFSISYAGVNIVAVPDEAL
jgi:hypothetical protein